MKIDPFYAEIPILMDNGKSPKILMDNGKMA